MSASWEFCKAGFIIFLKQYNEIRTDDNDVFIVECVLNALLDTY